VVGVCWGVVLLGGERGGGGCCDMCETFLGHMSRAAQSNPRKNGCFLT